MGTELCTDSYTAISYCKLQLFRKMRLAFNIFPISENINSEGPKSIIMFYIFSRSVIEVNLRFRNYN